MTRYPHRGRLLFWNTVTRYNWALWQAGQCQAGVLHSETRAGRRDNVTTNRLRPADGCWLQRRQNLLVARTRSNNTELNVDRVKSSGWIQLCWHLSSSSLPLCCSHTLVSSSLLPFSVNPFSTWRLHVAWKYIRWMCTRAARKENPNPNSHDHCCTE